MDLYFGSCILTSREQNPTTSPEQHDFTLSLDLNQFQNILIHYETLKKQFPIIQEIFPKNVFKHFHSDLNNSSEQSQSSSFDSDFVRIFYWKFYLILQSFSSESTDSVNPMMDVYSLFPLWIQENEDEK